MDYNKRYKTLKVGEAYIYNVNNFYSNLVIGVAFYLGGKPVTEVVGSLSATGRFDKDSESETIGGLDFALETNKRFDNAYDVVTVTVNELIGADSVKVTLIQNNNAATGGGGGGDGANAIDIYSDDGSVIQVGESILIGKKIRVKLKASGPKGDTGPAGKDGAKGEQGIKGDPGEKGEVGPQGEQGLPGEDGAAGIKGDPGEKGAQGEIGPQGPEGKKGDTGQAGKDGAKGETGAIGPQGVAGKDGKDGKDGNGGNTYHLALSDLIIGDTSKIVNQRIMYGYDSTIVKAITGSQPILNTVIWDDISNLRKFTVTLKATIYNVTGFKLSAPLNGVFFLGLLYKDGTGTSDKYNSPALPIKADKGYDITELSWTSGSISAGESGVCGLLIQFGKEASSLNWDSLAITSLDLSINFS